MANGPQKISDLPLANGVSNTDLFVVVKNVSSNAVTSSVTANAVFQAFNNNLSLGAYTGNIIPATNNTYTLGNSSHEWKSLYVSTNTIYITKFRNLFFDHDRC